MLLRVGLFITWICCYVVFAQTEQSSAAGNADIIGSADSGAIFVSQPNGGIPRQGLVEPPPGLRQGLVEPTPGLHANTTTSQQDLASQQGLEVTASQVPSSQVLSVGRSNTGTMSPVAAGERHTVLAQFQPGVFLSISDIAGADSGVAGSSSSSQAPAMNGVAGAPYTDSRYGQQGASFGANWRRVGKLWMRFSGSWYVCSASVIGRSLLVTAAHCVHNYGKGATGWPDIVNGQIQVYFEPGRDGTSTPLGQWWAQGMLIPTVYFQGNDQCSVAGIVCSNDLAVVWIRQQSNQQLGNIVGWNGYGWNGYSWATPASSFGFPSGTPASSLLTQLGYPVAFDSGTRAQIGIAATYISSNANVRNIIRGTAMTGGSSGGPWMANLGQDAVVSGTNYGDQALRDVVMGVTSWGYTDNSFKVQGASFFGDNTKITGTFGSRGRGNIAQLIYDACDNPAFTGWQLQSKGFCR